jgi:prephenate dehydrogenase
VCVVDLDGPPGQIPRDVRFRQADITQVEGGLAAELGEADVAVLAVPERVALAALPGVAEALPQGSLLAETLSVKSAIAQAASSISGLSVVGLNPMFAPSLGLEGRPVAAVVVHDGPGVEALLELIGSRGARVITLSAEAHDRLAAAAQTLTHASVLAFGFALAELGVSADELAAIAPPPHALLLAVLARISAGTPEVYWDVQAGNPFAPSAREALAGGLRRLAKVVEGGEEGFAAAMQELRDYFGDALDHHLDVCARAFAQASAGSGAAR